MTIILYAIWFVLEIIKYLIIARAIVSFLPLTRENQFIDVLYQVTEPLLTPIRALLFKSSIGRNAMLDLSSLVLFILIIFVQNFIGRFL
jgi:YggT family protein